MDIANEVFIFFKACALGAILGAFYDAFRIIRLSFKNPKFLVFIEDVLYFIILTILSFIFIVIENSGYLRVFLLLGELLGMILYFYTLSVVIMKCAQLIINFFKKIFGFMYKFIVKPLFGLFRSIYLALKSLISKIGDISKKFIPKFKIHLK